MTDTILQPTVHEKIVRYFEESGLDYGAWSSQFNMHFGYFRPGINPFNREALLNQLNKEVMKRLRIVAEEEADILDMGCGLGATARYVAGHYPKAKVHGVTITPWQVRHGEQLTKEAGLEERVFLREGDFCQTPMASSFADAVYAVESACYAPGKDKADLIREMYRTLKAGGHLVIMDGFRKHDRPLPRWLNRVYRKNMDCWALNDLADINALKAALKRAGFVNIQIEDISWNVAPSFLHVPLVSIQFLWNHWRKTGSLRLSKERWNNVTAPLLGMLMGLARKHFSYYLVSATKG